MNTITVLPFFNNIHYILIVYTVQVAIYTTNLNNIINIIQGGRGGSGGLVLNVPVMYGRFKGF